MSSNVRGRQLQVDRFVILCQSYPLDVASCRQVSRRLRHTACRNYCSQLLQPLISSQQLLQLAQRQHLIHYRHNRLHRPHLRSSANKNVNTVLRRLLATDTKRNLKTHWIMHVVLCKRG